MNSSGRLNLKQYAKHRGVSPAAVRKAIQTERLKVSVLRNQSTGEWEVDVAEADREWDVSTDPAMQRELTRRKGGAPPPGPMRPEQRQLLLELEAEVKSLGEMDLSKEGLQSFPEDPALLNDFQKLRTLSAQYEARKAHIEVQRLSGALLPAAEVRRALFQVWQQARNALANIAPRIAGEVASESNPAACEQLIAKEVHSVLSGLARQLREKQQMPVDEPQAARE